jgi:[NiFe] hydrogenase assembly HybE family chaperone
MALRVHASDPSPLLEAAFRRIERERMAGLPLLNPVLRVQALGFERWHGQWLGALVTPWFMNLVLVPGDAASWRAAADGERVFHRFGAGDFAFLGNDEPEAGEFQTCSLVSPMAGFADQDSACATARMALRMLHVEQPAAALMGAGDACAPGQAARAEREPPPSRRTMLFGTRERPPDAA